MAVTTGLGIPHMRANHRKYQWLAVPNGNTGNPIGSSVMEDMADLADRSVQVSGTFGAGGSCTIEGSNDGGVKFFTLNDAFGNALTFTTSSIKQITESVEQIRPNVTAGDGTTAIDVNLFMRKMIP